MHSFSLFGSWVILAFAWCAGCVQAQTSPDARQAAAAADKAASAAQSAAAAASAAAQSVQELKAAIPSDDDRFDGDKLKLRTRLIGFIEVEDTTGTKLWCAPADSEIKVFAEGTGTLRLRFLEVGKDEASGSDPQCGKGTLVSTNRAYRIDKSKLNDNAAYRRTGVTFGGLVVPFKYRLGGKEIVASATVAPYVGWRTGWLSSWGLTFTPLFSAGLGLVPVADPATGKSETKSAFSIAAGLVVTSSKNEKFQSGFLLGRDYVGRTAETQDPLTKKAWLSFYVGYAM